MLYEAGFQMLSQVAEFHDFLLFLLKTVGEVTKLGSAVRPTTLEGDGGHPNPIQRIHDRLSIVQSQLEQLVGQSATLIEGGAETLQLARLLSDVVQPGDLKQWKKLKSQTETLLEAATADTPEQGAFLNALAAVDGLAQKGNIDQSLDALAIVIEQLQAWSDASLSRKMRSAPAMRSLLLMRRLLSGRGRRHPYLGTEGPGTKPVTPANEPRT